MRQWCRDQEPQVITLSCFCSNGLWLYPLYRHKVCTSAYRYDIPSHGHCV